MFDVMEKRPIIPQQGDTWMESVAELMRTESIDLASFEYNGYRDSMSRSEGWAEMLRDKRDDFYYSDVLKSVREQGYVVPLTVCPPDYDDPECPDLPFRMGDGHHRIAAALDLGITHVPVMYFADPWESVSGDSGEWRYGSAPVMPSDDPDEYYD